MSAETVEVAVLGFAHGHVNACCNRWRTDPSMGVRVAAGWDHDAARLAAAGLQHGIEPCASPAELLNRPGLSAVVIAAETSMHADLVEQATQAGNASPTSQGERIAALAGPLADFLHGCRGPIATALEGRDVLRMVLACYESDRQGRRINLETQEKS